MAVFLLYLVMVASIRLWSLVELLEINYPNQIQIRRNIEHRVPLRIWCSQRDATAVAHWFWTTCITCVFVDMPRPGVHGNILI